RGRPRPVLEFTLLFVFVAASLAIANSQLAGELRAIGQPLGLLTMQYNLGSFAGWVLPLLLLIGLDMANFARQAAGWVTETITHRLPRWMPWLVLIPLLIWRLANVMAELNERVEASSPNAQAWEYAGAFVQVLLAVLLSWLILSLGRSRAAAPLTADGVASAAERHALPLIIVFNFLFLASALVADLGSAFPFPVIGDVVLKLIIFLSEANDPAWSLFVSVLALLAAFALAQRAHNAQPALAVYLGLFGGFQLWTKLTVPGRLLGAFYWRGPEPVDFWWVLLFSGVTLFWLARRQLTAARATRLIFLLLITALLRQTDFISSPFSPFLGFTGIGFIAFGLLWDTLTAGSWANADTRGLPRTSRILLYLGYALLTVTILNWAVTAHDLSTTGQFTGNVGTAALGGLGKPMLYAIFFITLAPPAHEAKTE
ncbi:MAG: hypothetical protein ACRDH2_17445, partial [Anaerolineales bacterium]